MRLTNEQLLKVCEASETQNFKVGDKFVMVYKNLNKEYKKDEIFTVSKIEQNTLFFRKSRQKVNRYFTDDSQLICKV